MPAPEIPPPQALLSAFTNVRKWNHFLNPKPQTRNVRKWNHFLNPKPQTRNVRKWNLPVVWRRSLM